MDLDDALKRSRLYFEEKVAQYGPTPQGVDFNGTAAQSVRFDQLVRIIEPTRPFTLIDFGCGYGALVPYLRTRAWDFTYWGFDEVETMIATARQAFGESDAVHFTTELQALPRCDFLIAGSIFNIKFDVPLETWRKHTLKVLDVMDSLCHRGMAFDILTSYSDPERMALRPDLYFADPLFYFDHCKRRFSPNVALLHDYGLYDFTVLIRKQV